LAEARYQVFVSSTFLDLKDERAAVVSALLQLEAFPAGMELFPAANDDAWTLIQRVIDSSDYYLLVIGGKYGSVDPETELSYTEKEFDYAVEQGKPVMAFLHENPDKIELGKSEKIESAREKLAQFRTKVEASKHVKFWNGSDDLAGKVALTFASFRQSYPAVGWVRGDQATSNETLGEINDLRKRIGEFEEETSRSQKGPPPGSEALAQGDELVDFDFRYSVAVSRSGEESWQSVNAAGSLDIDVTWNELFSCVGPEMLHEGTEQALLKRINSWLGKTFGSVARSVVAQRVESEDRKAEGFKRIEVLIGDEDFGTLIVQFRALGLIERSERPRSVKDTKTYWRLTLHGDEHLTKLRAIRREDEDGAPEGAPA
jgi:hypothetical protein